MHHDSVASSLNSKIGVTEQTNEETDRLITLTLHPRQGLKNRQTAADYSNPWAKVLNLIQENYKG